MWKTLRFRLAIWNILVVAITALVTLFGLRGGVRWALLHEMDQILTEDSVEIALALAEHTPGESDQLREELTRKATGHRHHGWFVQLLDEKSRVLWSSPGTPDEIPLAPLTEGVPVTLHNYRLVAKAIEPMRLDIARVRVGASLRLLQADLRRIDLLIVVAAGIVLVAAPLVGYWLAARAARTIGLITETAARLRPSHLAERLPINGTGDELDRLAVTINGLLDRIAADHKTKQDFLADAAHELRTPLAAIRSSVEVALNSPRSGEEYQNLLEEIIEQGSALEQLVNQLLLLSESETERVRDDPSPVDLGEIVTRAADMFEGAADVRGVELDAPRPAQVLIPGNRHLLRQLVNNLLDNAVKYTPPGGTVRVELCDDRDAKCVTLSVSDTGIGIPPADLPRIFDRFYRADKSRTRAANAVGTGLGLSICQAVVDAHRGTIACDSAPDRGTTMTVTLPRINSTTAIPKPPETAGVPASARTAP